MNKMSDIAPILYVFGAWIMTALEASGVDVAILLVLAMAFVSDYVMGVLAAFKTKSFKSRVGWIGFMAKLIGILLIISISMLFGIMGVPYRLSLTGMFTIFAINDILSALRHWYTIRTGKTLTEYDTITTFIRSMHEYLKRVAAKMFPGNNEGK